MPSSIAILDRRVNAGKGEAVRNGMLHVLASAPSRFIGFWDADLATPLSAVQDFLELVENRPDIDIILGSRVKLLGREIHRRPLRHYLGRVFATCASLTLGMPVYDTQCGAKLFRVTPILGEVLQRPFLSRWIFDVELIARFLTRDASMCKRMYEFPLYEWRDVAGSKVKPADFLRAITELWVIRHNYLSCRAYQPGRVLAGDANDSVSPVR
jgi:hypothetical protein